MTAGAYVYAVEGERDRRGRCWTRAAVAALHGIDQATVATQPYPVEVHERPDGRLEAVAYPTSVLALLHLAATGSSS